MQVTLGNNHKLVGQSLYVGKHVDKVYRIVYAEDIVADNAEADSARSCDTGSLNATLARGNVIVCFQTRGQRSPVVAAKSVSSAHGAGLIFAQFLTKDIAPVFELPCVQVDFETGSSILTYVESTKDAVVKFGHTKTAIGAMFPPEVAYFSSRGPSSLSPYVLKPDIAAPGVNILASWSPASTLSTNTPPVNFKIESGTSMSCPHVSAVVALLKSIHPKWSPAAIKSALITTASTSDDYHLDLVAEGAPHKRADPFDYGGGHINPNRAIDPGLIYDMGIPEYTNFLCSMEYNNSAVSSMTEHPTMCHNQTPESQKNLNLPSISIPHLRERATVVRTVTNVGSVTSVYSCRVEAPPGINVKVKPSVLSFNSTLKSLSFKVIFYSRFRVQGRYSFGSLSWEDGVHSVRIPIAVRTVVDGFLDSR
ncbi:uncharacterized protein A4U43_C08F180 [Asparagus officinalis]|nr:uncharacterized protein A4U43_C08F180 [Asparagus officinalis]